MMRWTAPTSGIAMCQNAVATYELLEGEPEPCEPEVALQIAEKDLDPLALAPGLEIGLGSNQGMGRHVAPCAYGQAGSSEATSTYGGKDAFRI